MSSSKISEIGKILGFGDRLRKLRVRKGLSQFELAQRVGRANASSINKYEDGQIPEKEILDAISHEFGTSVLYLLTGSGDPPAVMEDATPYQRLNRADQRLLSDVEKVLEEEEPIADLVRSQLRSVLRYRKQ